jgi:hypothetical protein
VPAGTAVGKNWWSLKDIPSLLPASRVSATKSHHLMFSWPAGSGVKSLWAIWQALKQLRFPREKGTGGYVFLVYCQKKVIYKIFLFNISMV